MLRGSVNLSGAEDEDEDEGAAAQAENTWDTTPRRGVACHEQLTEAEARNRATGSEHETGRRV